MAHGPVNRAWYLNIGKRTTYKIKESDYDTIKADVENCFIGVHLYADKTVKTVFLGCEESDLIENGYNKTNGRTFVKDDRVLDVATFDE